MKLHFYCMAIIAMLLYACNKRSEMVVQDSEEVDQTTTANENNNDQLKREDQLNRVDTVSMAASANNPPVIKNNNPDWDKRIIKTANLQLQLDDYKKFNLAVHNSLKQYSAYIAEENQQETDYRIENTLIIKVPVAQFDELINSFSGKDIKIMEKNISSDDVTGEVVDTKARMQAKIAVRDKYLQLLKQAKNMNEILQVQNEINEIQENIEAAKGRIDYLQHASAYSTINLNYYQYINGFADGDERPDFFTKLLRAFSTGTSFLSNLILFIISVWPLILGGCMVWIYLKKFRLKKA